MNNSPQAPIRSETEKIRVNYATRCGNLTSLLVPRRNSIGTNRSHNATIRSSLLYDLADVAFAAPLIGGIWAVFSKYQKLGELEVKMSKLLRSTMRVGWFAFFAVDAGVASLNNMSTEIFHSQLPYYFQGVSLAQKIIALAGIFILGTVTVLPMPSHQTSPSKRSVQQFPDFWEKPLTSIGFMALLLGVVLGLAQYWPTIVFAGFFLLLAGAMLYPLGILTEKELGPAGQ